MSICLRFLILIVISVPMAASACEISLRITAPAWTQVSSRFAKIEDAAASALQPHSGSLCVEFVANASDNRMAIDGVEDGVFEAALVPASALAQRYPVFAAFSGGYRFENAETMRAAFNELEWDLLNQPLQNFEVLGIVPTWPAFPAFQSSSFQDAPNFASELQVVSDPAEITLLGADAVLQTPARINSFILIANRYLIDKLSDENHSRLLDYVRIFEEVTSRQSNEEIEEFLSQARNFGLKSYKLSESARNELSEYVLNRVHQNLGTPIGWILQCAAGSCPCGGGTLCTSGCCAQR
jgi:hypothetical protein